MKHGFGEGEEQGPWPASQQSVWRSCFPAAGLSERMHESELHGPPCCWEEQCLEAELSHLCSVGQRMVLCCGAALGFCSAALLSWALVVSGGGSMVTFLHCFCLPGRFLLTFLHCV